MDKLLLTAGFAIVGLSLSAQNKSSETVPSLVPVQTIITVEARNSHDNGAPSLKREDVMAYERHDRLKVTDLVSFEGETAGPELIVLVDDASSMSLGIQLEDLRSFIEAQPAKTLIGIAYMQNGAVEMVQDLTANHRQAAEALRLPVSSAGVMDSPYLSLSDLIKKWPDHSSRREVVLITSGDGRLGSVGAMNPYLDGAIQDAQHSGIVVYAIYTSAIGHEGHNDWSVNRDQNHLAQIAEETGGEAYIQGIDPPVSFAPFLKEIAARLANQYRVTFLMKPETKGGFRSVKFATEVPNAELVTPARVYVPAAR